MGFDVAIIGGGFSGTMVLANLVRLSKQPLRIALIDPSGHVPLGVAYSTMQPEHLLNVAASRMGAFHDDPRDFYAWLQSRHLPNGENDFAPRMLYGEYLRGIFAETQRLADERNITITQLRTAITGITPEGLQAEDGTAIPAATVVLCTGNRFVPFTAPDKRYLTDVWQFDAKNLPPESETIALIGTGLTAVDVLASLDRAQWRGRIIALSRHAAFPQPHTESTAGWPGAWDTITSPRLSTLLRAIRQEIATAAKQNIPWQSVMDGLRPHTRRLWAALPVGDQQSMFSRYMNLWNVHRHRMPTAAQRMIESMRQSGQLEVRAGRVTGVEAQATQVIVRYGDTQLAAALAFDCTGPRLQDAPLTRALLESNLGRRCANGAGLHADANLRVSPPGALPVYAVGGLLTGMFLESTAAPELRGQAHTVAKALLKCS